MTGTAPASPVSADTTVDWFAAYNDKIAVAVLIQGASSGSNSAGDTARLVLEADQ